MVNVSDMILSKHKALTIYNTWWWWWFLSVNHLTPNGHYMGRTAQLTSICCILYIYSTNTRTEYFKNAA